MECISHRYKTTKEIIKRFDEKYGLDDAKNKCLEEMEELKQVLKKGEREFVTIDENAEEMAHVIVTVNKLAYSLGIEEEVRQEIKKTYRHLERILEVGEEQAEEEWRESK